MIIIKKDGETEDDTYDWICSFFLLNKIFEGNGETD